MTPDQVTQLILMIIKAGVLLGLGLYAVFAVILVRQEQLMESVLEEGFEPVLRALVWIHLLVSLALVGLSLVIL